MYPAKDCSEKETLPVFKQDITSRPTAFNVREALDKVADTVGVVFGEIPFPFGLLAFPDLWAVRVRFLASSEVIKLALAGKLNPTASGDGAGDDGVGVVKSTEAVSSTR